MTETTSIEARLRRLEDESAIRMLVADYCRVVDERDMDALRGMFTDDVVFGAKGAAQKLEGRENVVAYYESRYADMPISNHFNHDHFFRFESDDRARGYVNAHIELIRNGDPMIVSMRYLDTYVREEGAWKFKERLATFFYYLKVTDYLARIGQRKRHFGTPEGADADWPEGIATWQAYETVRG